MPKRDEKRRSDATYADVSYGLLRVILGLSRQQFFKAGTAVFQQGDEARSIFLVRSGLLEVSTVSVDGKKQILNVLKKGDLFGEIALLDHGQRSATVTATSDTRVMALTSADLTRQMQEHPELAKGLISLTVSRLRWVISAHEEQSFQPLDVRLARRLLYLADVMGDEFGNIALSQSDLAEHVGASREAASKCLADWQRKGIVSLGRRRIKLSDFGALKKLSQFAT